MKNFKTLALIALTAFSFTSCSDDDNDTMSENGTLTIKFDHSAEIGETLTDGADNEFTLTKLRYIVTDVTLIDENDEETVLSNDVAATMIDLSEATDGVVLKELSDLSEVTISGLKFTVGVSEDIHSSWESEEVDNQGVLYDMALATEADETDMFWSWALGYIFLKFEGEYTSTEATEFKSHIGNTGTGDTRTDRVMEVTVDFHGETVNYTGGDASIHLAIDVENMLTASQDVDVTTFENIHTFSDAISSNVEASVFSFSHQH